MHDRTTQRSGFLSLVLVLAACGPETDVEGGSMAQGSTSGVESSESSSEEGSSETTTNQEGSTTTGEPMCELPENDELDGSMITITIENRTSETRYISPYSSFECNYSQFELLLDGEPVLWDHPSVAASTCSICGIGCSDGGANGFVIGPGQVAEVQWNGGYWAGTTRSELCAEEACESDAESDVGSLECDVLRAMTAGEYTVRVNVFDTCPASLVESGECECDGAACEAYFYEPPSGDYTVEATAAFPDGAVVLLE